MDQSDFLTTAAQVAIGLAGFTGIASVFSYRSTAVPPEMQSERLRAMIETALIALVFSLVPLFLFDFQVSPETVWRVASASYLVAWTSLFVLTIRRGLAVLRSVQMQADRSWARIVGLAGVITLGSLLSGVIGYRPSSAYLLALLVQLTLCALYFCRFFLGLGSAAHSSE